MTRGGSLSGRIVDEQGRGVSGAWLHILDSRRILHTVRTSSNGSYNLPGLPAGECNIMPQVKNRIVSSVPEVSIIEGKTVRADDIVIRDGVPLTGRVLDAATGRPVEGVHVVIEHESKQRMTGSASDKQGRYEVRVLPGKVKASYAYGNPDYQACPESSPEVSVPARGLSGIDIKLKKCEVARGRVVDESGRPVGRAIVKCREMGVVRADAKGEFKFLLGAGSG